ncbi:hypothetical protein PRIPAC_85645 [Pristionchus pacificus]|uniref:Uncharacterized protein n=1 Tax=Pristionchus pacificus TaxID=54126 RepID=A0A2A6BMY8_PRIPA|nr:hypothetical protein PRIPAC_85645 [Pristionchus pacificus]|eukprot:PDM67269.1 hypothetical protein PRIPAC_48686 [Pristionchus pacificus]
MAQIQFYVAPKRRHSRTTSSTDEHSVATSPDQQQWDRLFQQYLGIDGNSFLSPVDMRQPLRSQSFKHRARPTVEVKSRNVLEEVAASNERRKSTPTISRRCSLQRGRIERTDVWPEPKSASGVEERFLKLPDCEDYTRVRQFKIDEKGAVVSRGDSFRRKQKPNVTKIEKSPSPYAVSGDSMRGDSCSDSVCSSDENRDRPSSDGAPSGSVPAVHKIYVVGDTGTGKSALISQFSTSEYRNAFADEIDHLDNSVSINIGGEESELVFLESDMADPLFLDDSVHAFLFLYSIDSKASFKQAVNGIEMVRNRPALRHTPIIVAGNKVDLERKRAVTKLEVRAAAAQFGFSTFEISVALNHDVDDLLIGLLADIKEAYGSEGAEKRRVVDFHEPSPRPCKKEPVQEDDFSSAIRRYSQRKKRQVDSVETGNGKCSSLSPSSFFNKLRVWRRGSSPRIEQ